MTPAVLRVRDDVLVLQTMMWPDEIRKPDFAGLSATEDAAKPNELKMAKMLVETLAGDYDPSEYEDDYAAAVEAVVRAKLEGGEVKPVAAETSHLGLGFAVMFARMLVRFRRFTRSAPLFSS